MSADVLREAARLMRGRAENANEGPWYVERNLHDHHASLMDKNPGGTPFSLSSDLVKSDARHIASWHPAVAVAVADWLYGEAELDDALKQHGATGLSGDSDAVKVARAYLGSDQ